MEDRLTIEVNNKAELPLTITVGGYEERVSFNCNWETLEATLKRHKSSGAYAGVLKVITNLNLALNVSSPEVDAIVNAVIYKEEANK
jgi:hypothetical protein